MYSTRITTHPIDSKNDLQSPIVRRPSVSPRRATRPYVVPSGSTRHLIQRKPLGRLGHRASGVLYRISSSSGQSNITIAQALHPRPRRLHGMFKRLSSGCQMFGQYSNNVRTVSKQCQNNVKTWFKYGPNIFETSLKCISHTSTISSSLCISRVVLPLVGNTKDIAI